MDTGAASKQPSMLSLATTALLCGVTLAWAYQERLSRVAQPVEVTTESAVSAVADKIVPWAPPAAVTQPVAQQEPAWPASDWGPSLADARGPWGAHAERLPTPPERTPAPATVAIEAIEPAPSEPYVADYESAAEKPFFIENEYAADPTPVALAPAALTPDDLAVQEQSVLLEEPTPTPAAPKQVAEVVVDPAVTPLPADPAVLAAAEYGPGELLTYTPAATEISQRVAADVRSAFSLGRHGALFAARRGFLDVMNQIAAAKDGEGATTAHTDALEEGLAALDEAQDFLSGGVVSKELSVAQAAASHRTPMLHKIEQGKPVLPHEAAALYYRYAEQKLAKAVGSEQAGSMALYGLGKTHAQLNTIEGDAADAQRSLAMYRAALLAHQANHLAANELGVGLAKAGHYRLAAESLDRAVTHGGGSTVYHNLAHVQNKLGQPRVAAETTRRAERLAVQERAAGVFSRERGVEWVPPQRMAGRTTMTAPPRTAAAPQAQPQRGVGRFARLPFKGDSRPPTAAPYRGAAVPFEANRAAAPVPSQTTVR